MNRCRIPIAAFTLIEMMIAVALGMLIVYTAVSGFRTAAQTIAVANRLSLENSLLRSGYFEAQIQLDFWTNYDDPTKPDSERPLKSDTSIGPTDWTSQGRNRGLPFTPMRSLHQRNLWQIAGTVPRVPDNGITLPGSGGVIGNAIKPRSQADVPVVGWELDRGWDPTFYWSPHDPRTWCRANLAEKDRPNGGIANDGTNNFPPFISGRYAIFSNTSPAGQTLHSYTIKPDLNHPDLAIRMTTQQVSYSGYPDMVNADSGSTSIPIYSWYANQLDSLVHAMGYAAFCDYLPSNSIYTWHSHTGDRTLGGINKLGVSPNHNFTNWDGDQRTSRGIYRNTYSRSYGYIDPRAWNDWGVEPFPTSGTPLTGDALRRRFYQHYNSDYGATDGGGAAELRAFIRHTIWHEPLIGAKPENWPELKVAVGRLLKNAHFIAVAKVNRISPLTGEEIELSWCGLGSTLRGARMQRHQNTGWARWDNAASATIDPNLDAP